VIPTGSFFDAGVIAGLLAEIREAAGDLERPISLMEVCGSHTHAIAASGLRRMLPGEIRLVSGPGCPVCVTPVEYLDRAFALAMEHRVMLATFGDLLRVPSSRGSLEKLRAEGGRVETVYSPRDAVMLAAKDPGTPLVFLAVGFETTAPTIAAALIEAERLGISNFMILPGNKLMPPPMAALAAADDIQIDGFLLPGHVSVITGSEAFEFLAGEFGLPGVVAGFTPADVLRAVLEMVRQHLEGRAEIVNLYGRVVRPDGNPQARNLLERCFEESDSVWRGLGVMENSGLALRREFAHRDASLLPVKLPEALEPPGCRCGEVLRGVIEPPECPLFGRICTPEEPTGACMVSSEGSCAAWYRHERWMRGEEDQ